MNGPECLAQHIGRRRQQVGQYLVRAAFQVGAGPPRRGLQHQRGRVAGAALGVRDGQDRHNVGPDEVDDAVGKLADTLGPHHRFAIPAGPRRPRVGVVGGGFDGRADRLGEETAEAELAVAEINSGIFAFDADVLRDSLAKVTSDNAQGEMYLTDVPLLAREAGHAVDALKIEDRWEVEGANDRVQLAELGAHLNRRILEAHMRTPS